jgi:hypothetical protein
MRTININGHDYRMHDPVTTDGMLDAFELYAESGDGSRATRKALKMAPLWAVLLDSDGNRYESPEAVGAVVPFADFGALTEVANSIIAGAQDDAPLASDESNSTE